MRFLPILAITIASAVAVPLAAPAADILGRVALPDPEVNARALVEALANALTNVGVSPKAVIANADIKDSSIVTDILDNNKVSALHRRNSVALPANIDTIVLAFIDAAVALGADVQAALANINIDQSTLLSNLGNNNVIFARSLPETVDIDSVVDAVANAIVAVGGNVDAVIGNIDIQNSNILTNILNGNTIIARRNNVVLPSNIDAIVLAFIDAAVAAGANVQAALANINIDQSTLLSNLGNNNVIFARSLPETVDIDSVVDAVANAIVAAGGNVDGVIGNIDIQNSNILTNILNGNTIIARRNNVALPANIDAIVLAFINALVAAGVDVQAAVANIGINYSTLLSNIGNNNVVFVRSLPEIVDIGTLVTALVNAAAAVGVDANAVIANLNIDNSSILTDILNGNTIVARNNVVLPANIDAIVLALINAAVAAGVDVQAAVANIGINYSTLLSNIGNNNVVFVRSLPEAVDIAALVKAIASAAAAVGVDINALIANIDIQNSSILTQILDGNTIVARNNVVLPANIDAIVLSLINALVAAGVDVQAAVANINIDYSTLLSNIGNNNVVFIRSLPETVDIATLVSALAAAAAKVGVNINAVIANLNVENSSILTDILNGNTVVA